ncbi:MAG: gamma-glutamylcyclotransferase [Nitrospirae bacterium]|nr:gamma-glutamylcyclotransferase [Nitrospirota bacterium]
MHNLFIHGTLRRGCSNNKLLSGADFIGCAETTQDYALFMVDKKPLITKRPVSKIKGDVYSMTEDMLTMVDRLKGHPRINKRELVSVKLEDGKTIEAWLYFHIHPLRNSILIESGEYTEQKT